MLTRPFSVAVIFLAVLLSGQSPAQQRQQQVQLPPLSPEAVAYLDSLRPSEQYQKLFRSIYSIVVRLHYLKRPLTLEFGKEVYREYFERLDPQNSLFLASDLKPLEKADDYLYKSLSERNITLPTSIYQLQQRRIIQALLYQIALLDQHRFDFERREHLLIDREDAAAPADWRQWQDYWRRVIKNQLLSLLLDDVPEEQAMDRLRRRLTNRLHTVLRKSPEYALATFAKALLAQYDPHTSYMPPEEYRDWLITLQTQLEGIGAVLTVRDDYVEVVRLISGGPAEKSRQLGPGDRIIGVARQKGEPVRDVVGMNLNDVVRLIRGKKGTVVQLEVLPKTADYGAAPEELELVRDVITLEDQRASAEMLELKIKGHSWRIGVISLPSFYGASPSAKSAHSASEDIRKFIRDLKARQMNALILDMRNNGGGYLHEANAVASLFLPQGAFVQIKDERGRIKPASAQRKGIAWEGPMAVMVNRLSASASEIVAAAIQDYRRGLVIGTTTFGKGTVQATFSVPNQQGQLKLTRSQFYRVSGGATQNKGVIPDVMLPAVLDPREVGESANENALAFDQVRSLLHSNQLRWPVADFNYLNRNHRSRRASSAAMRYLEKRFTLLESIRADDRLPLWTQARRQRKERTEQAQLALENELRIAGGDAAFAHWKDYTAWLREQRADPDFTYDWQQALLEETGYILAEHTARAWPEYTERGSGPQAVRQ